MIRHILAAAAFVLAPHGAAASVEAECKSELPAARTGHWSWRNVDGKRCWYRGQPGRAKATLRWPRSVPPPAPRDIGSDRELLESYWPKLDLEKLPFTERWPQ
jgi:hypothetical protein